jgi:hypothetical protein
MTYFLKRGLPFILTLMVGSGLGSIFGFHSSKDTTTDNSSVFRWERHHRHYHSGCRGKDFSDTTPLMITNQPEARVMLIALKHKTTGVVQLRVRFNADGTTTVIERLATLPDGLTEEAERIAGNTTFIPETRDGEPVPVVRDMNYAFPLPPNISMGGGESR